MKTKRIVVLSLFGAIVVATIFLTNIFGLRAFIIGNIYQYNATNRKILINNINENSNLKEPLLLAQTDYIAVETDITYYDKNDTLTVYNDDYTISFTEYPYNTFPKLLTHQSITSPEYNVYGICVGDNFATVKEKMDYISENISPKPWKLEKPTERSAIPSIFASDKIAPSQDLRYKSMGVGIVFVCDADQTISDILVSVPARIID